MPATAFQTQQSFARNRVISPNQQAAYGTPLQDVSLTRRARFNPSAALERMITYRNDKTSAGKSTEFATNSTIVAYDTKLTFKDEMDDFLIGYLLTNACGQDLVSGPVAGAYTHAFGFNEAFNQRAVCTTFYVEDTNDLKRLVPDMSLVDLTISIPESGSIGFESNWVGSGRVVPHIMAALPALPAPTYLLASDCEFMLGPSGAPLDITGRLRSATIKIQTGTTTWHAPGDQGYGIFNRTDLRKFSLSMVIAAKDIDDIEGPANAGTLMAVTLAITASPTCALTITLPAFQMKATKMGTQGNLTYWNVEADETTIMPTAGGDGPLDIIVVNTVPQYLLGA